ncbi:LytR/AlgR family response regulator transcription factor [Flavivirga algicola]|uniref:Response regulator transcription factor n=1 Tax=Flavivirga algicola TaxID=2729136 RepID=A0ABX1S0Z5_9FLAO|nr:LytTR family DNA-binding domain-containing protein [Flavivirga algicola]NMH88548.1 response regulator transcription factor [Flavivirga algicola]
MQKPYTTLIIDDEPLARERLNKLLINFPETINIIGSAKNGTDAKQKIKALSPDLIFLDIEMPGLTGFQLIESLETIPLIVFCTAYDTYSLKAFETNSIDYLVKPVRLERLEKTMGKLKQFNTRSTSQDILDVIKNITVAKEERKMTSIAVKKGDKLIFLKLDDIFYFEASDKYVTINTDKEGFITEKSLSQLESRLPDYFLRVHRSFIVNINCVKEIQKYFNSKYVISLNNKKRTNITTGRSYKEKIKEWIDM